MSEEEVDVGEALLRQRTWPGEVENEPYLIGNNTARNVVTGEKNERLENLIMMFLVGAIVVVFGIVMRTVGSHLADDLALVLIVLGIVIIAGAYVFFLWSGFRLETGVPEDVARKASKRID